MSSRLAGAGRRVPRFVVLVFAIVSAIIAGSTALTGDSAIDSGYWAGSVAAALAGLAFSWFRNRRLTAGQRVELAAVVASGVPSGDPRVTQLARARLRDERLDDRIRIILAPLILAAPFIAVARAGMPWLWTLPGCVLFAVLAVTTGRHDAQRRLNRLANGW